MTRKKHSIDGFELAIIGETANINFFLNTALQPDSETDVVNKQSSKKAHTRRRYVGDATPSNVSAHDYVFMVDPGRIDLQTLPGKPFILQAGGERRQFTYVGNVIDLHAFLVSDVKAETKLYTVGPPYVIAAAQSGLKVS
jgi:hypothetical protein